MGGNALKQYQTTRLPAREYFALVAEFSAKFEMVYGFKPVLIKSYRQKLSFGDADFLINSYYLFKNWDVALREHFGLSETQYVKNGNVVSIGYKNFQIDLIVTPDSEMAASEFYFAYNDFGNLIGRIGHKLGVKIGHKGVSLIVRHRARSDHVLAEIFVTRDMYEALDLLGLSRKTYDDGFETLEDMFAYVASSRYFDPEIYSLEHRSATSRIRDKKRATYSAFLKWDDTTKPVARHQFADKSELGGYSLRMPYYETEVLARWPSVKPQVETVIDDFELDMRFKEVYNGVIVEQQTGFTGKKLGAFMALMKPRIDRNRKMLWTAQPQLAELGIANLFCEVGGINF